MAPTAFKGTLGPGAAARAMAAGAVRVWPSAEVLERPLADGGNGLIEACSALEGGELETTEVTGPCGGPTRARWLRLGARAVVESAEGCGLHLVAPERRDPLVAGTRGVGELLAAARERGAEEVLLGLGGSATVDGGVGMARALGWEFLDARGRPIAEGGGGLIELRRIQAPRQGFPARVRVLCDVANPLLGPRGAARVYGPQKGADAAAVARLERGLARLAEVLERQMGLLVVGIPGAGAAGGLGAGARAFLDGELVSGAEWMIAQARVSEILASADLVVTGEGRFDEQSGMGKLTGRVIELARAARVPALLVCGKVEGAMGAGVTAIDGGGRILDAAGLARLTERACRALAGGGRL